MMKLKIQTIATSKFNVSVAWFVWFIKKWCD